MSEAKQKANAQSGRSLLGSCKEWPWAFRPKLLNCADLVNLLRFQGVGCMEAVGLYSNLYLGQLHVSYSNCQMPELRSITGLAC